jgi:hypothetical protein
VSACVETWQFQGKEGEVEVEVEKHGSRYVADDMRQLRLRQEYAQDRVV